MVKQRNLNHYFVKLAKPGSSQLNTQENELQKQNDRIYYNILSYLCAKTH